MPHIYVPLPLGFSPSDHRNSVNVEQGQYETLQSATTTTDTNYHHILSYFYQLGNFLRTFEDIHKTHPDDFLLKLISDVVVSSDTCLIDRVLLEMEGNSYLAPHNIKTTLSLENPITVEPMLPHGGRESQSAEPSMRNSSNIGDNSIFSRETKGNNCVITPLCMELIKEEGFVQFCINCTEYDIPEQNSNNGKDTSTSHTSVLSTLIKYGLKKNEKMSTDSYKVPIASSSMTLQHFFEEIERLKIRRDYKEFISLNTINTANNNINTSRGKGTSTEKQSCGHDASVNNLEGVCSRVLLTLTPGSSHFISRYNNSYSNNNEERKKRDKVKRIRDGLLCKGMGDKKKHEVTMIHNVIGDLLKIIQNQQEETDREAEGTTRMSPVIINVGEGKGYASKIISTCEGVPIIGLDCNPMHKEAALERSDDVLLSVSIPCEYSTPDSSIGEAGNNNTPCDRLSSKNTGCNNNSREVKDKRARPKIDEVSNKRDCINLQYETRGKMTCVTCRIGNTTTSPNPPEMMVIDEKRYNDNRSDQKTMTVPTTSCNLIQQLTKVLEDHNICQSHIKTKRSTSELEDEEEMKGYINDLSVKGPVSVKLQCILCNKIFGALQNNQHSGEIQLSSIEHDNRKTKAKNGAALVCHSYQHMKNIEKQEESAAMIKGEGLKSVESDKMGPLQGNATSEKENKNEDDDKYKEQIWSHFKSIPEWRSTKTPDDFLQMVISNCYTTLTPQSAAGQKRERDRSSNKSSSSFDVHAQPADQPKSTESLSVLRVYPRGTMVIVNGYISVITKQSVSQQKGQQTPVDEPADVVLSQQQVSDCVLQLSCTILGYDEGSNKHKVYIHYPDNMENGYNQGNENVIIPSVLFGRTVMMVLHQHSTSCERNISSNNHLSSVKYSSFTVSGSSSYQSSSVSTSTSDGKYTVVFSPLHVESIASKPPIYPSLCLRTYSNAIFMGLHPCGDLGSNICRMYGSCKAMGLLLVSCCWHALTEDGFPMVEIPEQSLLHSQAPSLYSNNLITSSMGRKPNFNSMSRMLATQPTDMQDRCGTSDHLASIKLSFLRGILPIFWDHVIMKGLHRRLEASGGSQIPQLLSKLQLPTFDRAILRHIAKEKHSITFVNLCKLVRDKLLQLPLLTKDNTSVIGTSVCPDNIGESSDESFTVINNFFFGTCGQNGECNDECSSTHIDIASKQACGTVSLYEALASTFQNMIFPPRNYAADSVRVQGAPYTYTHISSLSSPSAYSLLFPLYVSFSVLRTWMAPLVESYFLLDRVLYIHYLHLKESECDAGNGKKQNHMDTDKNKSNDVKGESAVAIIPMFDGTLSPRLFGIVALRSVSQ